VSTDHSYEISTIQLGPHDDLSQLAADLANHASTAATPASQVKGQIVVSVSHSITAIEGKLFGTVLLTTDTQD
jgi:hypothetical protein